MLAEYKGELKALASFVSGRLLPNMSVRKALRDALPFIRELCVFTRVSPMDAVVAEWCDGNMLGKSQQSSGAMKLMDCCVELWRTMEGLDAGESFVCRVYGAAEDDVYCCLVEGNDPDGTLKVLVSTSDVLVFLSSSARAGFSRRCLRSWTRACPT